MANKNEDFLKLIEEAEDITDTLSALQEEIESYDAAGKNLELARKDLQKYIETAHQASVNMLALTDSIVGKINSINKNTEQIYLANEEAFNEVYNRINSLKPLIFIAIGASIGAILISILL